MTTEITTAAAVADVLDSEIRRALELARRPPTPHRYVYASARRECLRRTVYEMTVPDQQVPLDADVLARMERGQAREDDLLAMLSRIGRRADASWRITNQQERFELRDRKGRVVVVGKVDARVEFGATRAPVEVKTWAPYVVDRIEKFDDVFASPWTRTGGYQLLSYLFGAAEPFGFLLLDRAGVPKLVPVNLDPHLDKVESFLTDAERALDHVDAGTLPEYLVGEPEECTTRCPFFGATCNPPLAGHGELQVLTDPELEAALERREELRRPGKAFAELDAEIKQRLRGVTRAVIGKFEIRGAWGKQSRLDLPRDLKEKYTRVDPEGRFTLTITKHG